MTLAQKIVAAISLAVVFNVSLLAQAYTIQNKTLKEALEIIASQSKLSYAGDPALLESKKANNIENVEGLEKALEQLFKDTGLEAMVKDSTIILHESNDISTLNAISISASQDATTEGTGSYTSKSMNTATRMNLSIKETPQSVTVITQQQIEDRGLENLTDIVNTTTGLSSTNYDSERNAYSARGFYIENYQIDGVTTTYDSAWMSGETQQDLTLYDRVEIVRGSTGLLTGAGNPSAAINLVRKHANSKEFTGTVSLEGGSWDKYKSSLDISTPVNEAKTVRARIATSYEDKKSFYDFYESKKSVVYGIVDIDISDDTKASMGASYQKNDPKGSMWGGLPSKFSDGTTTDWSRSKSTASDWTYWASENKNYFTSIEHSFKNNIKLYGAYAYSDNSMSSKLIWPYGTLDKDTGTGYGIWAAGYDSTSKQHNVDLYASIPFEINGLEHEIVAGFMYTKNDFRAYSNTASGYEEVNDNFYTYSGISEPTSWTKSLLSDATTTQNGSYIVGRFSLMDDLKLIAGARLSNWEYQCSFGWECPNTYEYKNEITPYAGLVYTINDTYSTYVSYTDIFNPQSVKDKYGNLLDPVEGKNYEMGIKGEFFNNRLNASVAVFRIEQDNVAQTDPSGAFVQGTTTVASIAAEGVTSEGFEIDINGEITDAWNISMGYAQFEAKDIDGEKFNTVSPRKTLKVFTKYSWNKYTVGAGANWQDEVYSNGVYQDAYTLVNVMAKYAFTKQLSAQVNVNNLLDKKYYTNVGFYSQVAYGEPINATVSFKYTF